MSQQSLRTEYTTVLCAFAHVLLLVELYNYSTENLISS